MEHLTRRRFLQLTTTAAGVFALRPAYSADSPTTDAQEKAAFFLVGDTHYLADKEKPEEMDAVSKENNARLIGWLNKLPGTEITAEAGGGKVADVRGVIHAGDCIDSGDKTGGPHPAMQKTELEAFAADWGLNGGDGKLRWPVREVWGNHDSPRGTGQFIERFSERNKARTGLAKVSPNGMHYSWDWNGVHFVNVGIVVGHVREIERPRPYATMESLDFLLGDLAEHVGDSGRPVVITHHVDVARYCLPVEDEKVLKHEWDYADVAGYHGALKNYRVAAILYGHTHARRIFAWDGTPPKPAKPGEPPAKGIAVFNTDNAAHFKSETQALMYFEVSSKEIVAREFATADSWQTAAWTPQSWRFPLA
jgi:predicted phosphodiesterase